FFLDGGRAGRLGAPVLPGRPAGVSAPGAARGAEDQRVWPAEQAAGGDTGETAGELQPPLVAQPGAYAGPASAQGPTATAPAARLHPAGRGAQASPHREGSQAGGDAGRAARSAQGLLFLYPACGSREGAGAALAVGSAQKTPGQAS